MALSKTSAPYSRNLLADTGLSGKAVTNIHAYNHGSVTVIEISYSGGSQLIKVRQGEVEIGGGADWNGKPLL